jgi:hypothetical protein
MSTLSVQRESYDVIVTKIVADVALLAHRAHVESPIAQY